MMVSYRDRICFGASRQTQEQLRALEKLEGLKRGELIRAIIREAHEKKVASK